MASRGSAIKAEGEEHVSSGPPAGGLDMPKPPTRLDLESFPGENSLTEEEKNRWLILHFSVPRTIMTCDMTEGRSTEQELNDVLAVMSWGTINSETSEWVLESEDPSLDAPHPSLISYAEFAARMYPDDPNMEDEARKANVRMAAEKRFTFTDHGEPGVKFRPQFDQMVRCLAYVNKALTKAYDIKKVVLNEDEEPENPSAEDFTNIVRYGRHQILPSFWNLLIHLSKPGARRRFSIVFRTWGPEIPVIQRELKYFCQGQHPAFSGQNKTQKPPPMDGSKGSRDLRLTDEQLGRFDRMSSRLEFANREMNKGTSAEAAAPAVEVDGELQIEKMFQPTVYEYPPFHSPYAGLMHQILDGANTAAIVDDRAYWEARGRESTAGKLLLVDHGGGFAETKVQHILFDGHIRAGDAHCVDVRDVVSGEPLPFETAEGTFVHRVNLHQAVVDNDYFIKALESCELKMSQGIVESRRMEGIKAGAEEKTQDLKALDPKEYLYRTVIPALLPALEACQRDRPADPVEYIAFYMLRHTKQYSKTLTS